MEEGGTDGEKTSPLQRTHTQNTGFLQPACQGAPSGHYMFSPCTWPEQKEIRDLHVDSPCVTSGSTFFRGPGLEGRDEVCHAMESIQASAN